MVVVGASALMVPPTNEVEVVPFSVVVVVGGCVSAVRVITVVSRLVSSAVSPVALLTAVTTSLLNRVWNTLTPPPDNPLPSVALARVKFTKLSRSDVVSKVAVTTTRTALPLSVARRRCRPDAGTLEQEDEALVAPLTEVNTWQTK